MVQGFTNHMTLHTIKEDNSTIVGRGEKILVEILKEKLSDVKIFTQVHLKWIVPKEEATEFSERQIKETVDVLVYYRNNWIIFRVQHGSTQKYHSKGHLGDKLAQSDLVQKILIQRYHGSHSVIDLRESECKILFSDTNNWYSQSEVGIQCELEKLKL
jgi:hypothetical protein